MANPQHIEWLLEGVDKWNARRAVSEFTPDFERADIYRIFWNSNLLDDLGKIPLLGVDLHDANLARTSFLWANLFSADLTSANLTSANLSNTMLVGASLNDANLLFAILEGATLIGAKLSGANLQRANLANANLDGATVVNANFINANLKGTSLAGTEIWKAILFPEGLSPKQHSFG